MTTNGYPSRPSARPGDTITLHVSTDAAQWRVEFNRVGAAFSGQSAWFAGQSFPMIDSTLDWSGTWTGVQFTIPADWPPGVYVGTLVEGDGSGNPLQAVDPTVVFAPSAQLLLVIMNPSPGSGATILYSLPFFTYCAYNNVGPANRNQADPSDIDHNSAYTQNFDPKKVTFHRPGNGTGGSPWDSFLADLFDGTSPRQTFAHWDAKFIIWLEANGYSVDYCTHLDLHQDTQLLSHYCLLLSVGHDEYWSQPLRDHVQAFVDSGGNVAFFSGNVCWWRITLTDNDTALVVDKTHTSTTFINGGQVGADQWALIQPEESLTGVSYRFAGGQWKDDRPSPSGYIVQNTHHWVFDGAGLTDGASLGAETPPAEPGGPPGGALVGYEADGTPFVLDAMMNATHTSTPSNSTPPDFEILGRQSVAGWQDQLAGSASAATMGIYAHAGTVFTAATVDWARVLASGDVQVGRMTRNILDRLNSVGVRVRGPYPGLCDRLVAVEGTRVRFYADTSRLPSNATLRFVWSASSGSPVSLPGSLYELDLPLGTAPITVTVAVTAQGSGVKCDGFGWFTFTPISIVQAEWLEFLCALRSLVLGAERVRKAVVGVGGERENPLFVDPLFDPIDPDMPFFSLADLRMPDRATAKAMARVAEIALQYITRMNGRFREDLSSRR